MILENYYKYVIKRDLVNKFKYKSIKQIPKLTEIILNFGCKTNNLKTISAAALAIELLVSKKGVVVKSKKTNLILKIRKGQPVSCVGSVRGPKANLLFSKISLEVFPLIKDFKGVFIKKNTKQTDAVFSLTLRQLTAFQDLEDNFYLFNNLPDLNINFVITNCSSSEIFYLLKSQKIPFSKCNCNSIW